MSKDNLVWEMAQVITTPHGLVLDMKSTQEIKKEDTEPCPLCGGVEFIPCAEEGVFAALGCSGYMCAHCY